LLVVIEFSVSLYLPKANAAAAEAIRAINADPWLGGHPLEAHLLDFAQAKDAYI